MAPRAGRLTRRLDPECLEPEEAHDRALVHLQIRDLRERNGRLDLGEHALVDNQASFRQIAANACDVTVDEQPCDEQRERQERHADHGDERRNHRQEQPVLLHPGIDVSVQEHAIDLFHKTPPACTAGIILSRRPPHILLASMRAITTLHALTHVAIMSVTAEEGAP